MSQVNSNPDEPTLPILVDNHQNFLSFLERRAGSRELAEDILQTAFAKAVEQVDRLDGGTVVAWFYRVLRNALIDHYRRRSVEERALAEQCDQLVSTAAEDSELERTICECFRKLLPTLTPQSRSILERVDLGDQTVGEAAQSLGITPNNAGVRLYRARLALKERLEQTCRTCAQHGCYDCTCGKY
jgi:RNA polymerase sigma-70 factor (ECF subfamily)